MCGAFRCFKTYEQKVKGDQAIVSLHYFAGSQANWYMTEKDKLAMWPGPSCPRIYPVWAVGSILVPDGCDSR